MSLNLLQRYRRIISLPLELVCVILLGVTLWGALRLQMAIEYKDWLSRFGPGWIYMAATGLMMTLGGLGCVAVIFFWQRRARWVVGLFTLAVSGLYWLERLFLTEQNHGQRGWPVALAVNVFLAAWVLLVLRPTWRQTNFREADDEQR